MKKTKLILFIIIIVSIFWFYFIYGKKNNCQGNEFFKNMSFFGVVTNKYIDTEQHSIPVIDLLDLKNKKIRKIDFFLELTDGYQKIRVSDTIIKKRGSMNIYVLKNGSQVFLTAVEFSCQ